MRRLIKYLVEKTYAPVLLRYLERDRYYSHKGIRLLVRKNVFHPGFFFSTKFLLNTLAQYPLKNKTLLELGAGSGLISFYTAKQGALVTATDISPDAVEGLNKNAQTLLLPVEIIQSDLFENLNGKHFDYIVINPPYYPMPVQHEKDLAWYCGSDFEYFKKLFPQLKNHAQPNSYILMSLSEDCDIEHIRSLAATNNLTLRLLKQKRILWEQNYVFSIESN